MFVFKSNGFENIDYKKHGISGFLEQEQRFLSGKVHLVFGHAADYFCG